MASGVMHLLFKSGFSVIALELDRPLSVRRMVCFSEAVYESSWTVEGVTAVLSESVSDIEEILSQGKIPIRIDSEGEYIITNKDCMVVDARMLKQNVAYVLNDNQPIIGLGPGFTVGTNCQAVIETNRGVNLGKVIYNGAAEADTGLPAEINGIGVKRVVRADHSGRFLEHKQIGEVIQTGETIGEIDRQPVISAIGGIVRGLIRTDSIVVKGQKIGDVDPRGDKELCYQISDKAQAIALGVHAAIGKLSSGI